MLESFDTFCDSWVCFGSVRVYTYFYWKCERWIKVGRNLALNEDNTIKWFEDKTKILPAKEETNE